MKGLYLPMIRGAGHHAGLLQVCAYVGTFSVSCRYSSDRRGCMHFRGLPHTRPTMCLGSSLAGGALWPCPVPCAAWYPL